MSPFLAAHKIEAPFLLIHGSEARLRLRTRPNPRLDRTALHALWRGCAAPWRVSVVTVKTLDEGLLSLPPRAAPPQEISPSLRRTTTRAPFRCSPSAFSRPAPASHARHLRLYPRAAPAPLMKVAWRRRSRATAERHGWCCCRWRATGTRQRSRCRPALLLPGSAPGQAVRKGAPLSMLLRARCFTCSLKCSRGCARTYRPR